MRIDDVPVPHPVHWSARDACKEIMEGGVGRAPLPKYKQPQVGNERTSGNQGEEVPRSGEAALLPRRALLAAWT